MVWFEYSVNIEYWNYYENERFRFY